jgi:GDP-L-fucose synthase
MSTTRVGAAVDKHSPFVLKGKQVWVAGHRGMVGSAVVRRLCVEECEIMTVERDRLDLTRQCQVDQWVGAHRPQVVVICAARVGGILANDSRPVDFLHDNLSIETSIINAAHSHGVEKLLFLGSSCIYPRLAPSPISEDSLLTGSLEPTNQWYAIAKIAGLKLCEAYRRQYGADFISAIPTNLYGPGDNFDLRSSHVVPALMRKAHIAKLDGSHQVKVWGTGKIRREFLYIEDLADALVFLLKNYSQDQTINVGTGTDLTIEQLAEQICEVVGLNPQLDFDRSKPDGTPRKLLDIRRIAELGWAPKTLLADGLRSTYAWFLEHLHDYRGHESGVKVSTGVPAQF